MLVNNCDYFWVLQRGKHEFAGSPFLRLGNGKHLKFGRLVRAERTEQAGKFKEEVNRIISENISKMLDSLGHKRNDYVFKLPKE